MLHQRLLELGYEEVGEVVGGACSVLVGSSGGRVAVACSFISIIAVCTACVRAASRVEAISILGVGDTTP